MAEGAGQSIFSGDSRERGRTKVKYVKPAVHLIFLTVSLIAAIASGSDAAEGSSERVRLGIDIWAGQGEGEWQISSEEDYAPLGAVKARSRLDWDHIDSIVLVLDCQIKLTSWLAISGRFGRGDIEDGAEIPIPIG